MIFPQFEALLEKPFSRLPQKQFGSGNGGFGLGLALGVLYVPCAGPVLAAVGAAIVGWFAVQARQWVWAAVFAVIAVAWNPVFPFGFDGLVWSLVQPAAGRLLVHERSQVARSSQFAQHGACRRAKVREVVDDQKAFLPVLQHQHDLPWND